MASDSLLFYFITNVLRFENFSTRERGWGGADARSRGEKIERIHEATKTRYIQIHVTFVHLDIHWILFEASIARSLSFSRTHTNVLSLAPFFFFFFVFKLSRAIDSMATRENSLELSQYRNNYSISIAKCFSMFCTNFCSLLFLC